MRLENFDLVKPFGQIWLRGLGCGVQRNPFRFGEAEHVRG
jgi:hypothetical protein